MTSVATFDGTILSRYAASHASWFDAIAGAAGGRRVTTEAWSAADVGRAAGFFNSATLLRPVREGEAERAIGEIDEWFGSGEAFLWSPWPTPDFGLRGWELVGYPPLLVRFPSGPLPPAGTDLRVEAVRDAAGLLAWQHVVGAGFPIEGLQRWPGRFLGDGILDDPRISLWVGYEGDRPVTSGSLFVDGGLAQFALGVTVPEARRRGHWYTMMRVRLEAAGEALGAALFSDASRPGAERIGFVPVLRFTCWRRA